MIPKLREQFNAQFSEVRYNAFLDELNSILKYPTDFRVCETPLFLSYEFNQDLLKACDEITAQLITKEFKEKSVNAIPKHLNVPNDTDHPIFLSLDFAITKNENDFVPKLIELQGFPTLYGYQYFLNRVVRKYFDIPDDFTCYYSGYDEDEYVDFLERIILANEDAEQVILLEIEPHKQKTRIDFAAMEKLIGIPEVCITDLIKKNKKLFYKKRRKRN